MPARHVNIGHSRVKDGADARCHWPAPGTRVTEAIRHDSGLVATRREHVPLGILYMVGATIVFAMSSAASKWLVDIYPVGEVLFTRAGLSLIACALVILPQTGLAVFHTSRRRDHVLRTLSQTFSQTFLLTVLQVVTGRHTVFQHSLYQVPATVSYVVQQPSFQQVSQTGLQPVHQTSL